MHTIRVATPSDIPTIATIHEMGWRHAYHFMPGEVLNNRDKAFRHQQWSNWFAQDKPNQDEVLYILENGERTIGFCMGKPNDDSMLIGAKGELHALYIDPICKTFGISLLAINALSKYLLERNLDPVCCWAFQENRIWRWYERLGFKRVIARNRQIANVDVPEFGLIHFEPEKLIKITERQLQAAS